VTTKLAVTRTRSIWLFFVKCGAHATYN
jgi:hypothetical protein